MEKMFLSPLKPLLMERTSARSPMSETAKNTIIVVFIFAMLALISYVQWKVTIVQLP
jgi:hypothetical protein